MNWINLQNVNLGFGGPLLLEDVNLQIQEQEKIALIGRNGVGKSTLMKLILGELVVDNGEIQRRQGARITYLTQEVPQELQGFVFNVVAEGLGESGATLRRYNEISHQLASQSSPKLLQELEQTQKQLDETGGWQELQGVEETISRLSLDAEEKFENLSAGKKRRVLLARALVKKPDLLLLDEPTNHLDISSIRWLEDFFSRYEGTILFITHDRSFLKKVATRILELDRGCLTSWDCDYDTYLQRKDDLLAAEEKQQQEFDKKLAQEEVWIRKGVRARRTRNEGRVKRLKDMREEHKQRRKKLGSVKMIAQQAERSGNLIIHADSIHFGYGEKTIFQDFSTTVMRGDKLGIIGPNGCGKTTLLKVLLGELAPQQGSIRLGTNLQVAYFDQLRNKLDRNKTVLENVGEGSETVTVNGQKKHIMGYIQDFLFEPGDAHKEVWSLSGGEQNRLLFAKLFLQPSNVLVLDEPTNDLDTDTLELLEQLVIDYPGAVLIVSHDRTFLNNVATTTLAFEDDNVKEYIGGYDDWLRQRPQPEEKAKKQVSHQKRPKERKLTFKEKQELEELPLKIEQLEEEQQELYQITSDAKFYQQSGDKVAEIQKRLKEITEELELAYARWEELEAVIQ